MHNLLLPLSIPLVIQLIICLYPSYRPDEASIDSLAV